MSRLLFRWTNQALIAANVGRAFTHSGLEALCSSHVSDKRDGNEQDFTAEANAKTAVDKIRERELKVYCDSPSRVIQDARLEVETGRDYSNRLLLELMQNADDAAATARIGYKGLGFKSVLDVCESARIYSGRLRVQFDREESRRALQEKGLTQLNEVPVLRLPFWNDVDRDDGVDQLVEQYRTVIVLPWKGGVVPAVFGDEWKSVRDDASVLLLLHALEEVIWEGPLGEHVEWKCERGNKIELSVTKSPDAPKPSWWQSFRDPTGNHQSAAVVLLDEMDKPAPYRHDKLRVFFSTEETSPLPLILHGEFDLEQNRKHVRPGNTRHTIVQSLAACVKRALTEVADDGRFLDLLRPRIPPENMTGLEREIWDAVRSVVREMKLPASQVTLSAVRLCHDASAEGLPWDWQRQRLDNWKTLKALLATRRPGGLAGLNVLLPGTDTEDREKTICAFSPAAHLSVTELRQQTLFPVAGSDSPVTASDHCLFFPPEKMVTTVALPGVPIAFLREGFAADCKKHAPVRQLLENLGVAEFSPSAIAAALAKPRRDAAPDETLWRFLFSTVAPMLKDEDAVLDWKAKHRQILAEHIKVPCRDGAWQVAVNVYAGQDWTGNDFLQRAYGSDPQRYFLAAPPGDEKQRKDRERLARWLGVGWSPKVLPIENHEDTSGTRKGVAWQNGHFTVPNPPARWPAHCAELDDSENAARTARLRQDWTIDGDEAVLKFDGAFACVTGEWRNYGDCLQVIFYRSGNQQRDHDDKRRTGPSYLSHLFRHVPWVPAAESGQCVASRDVFTEGGEVHQALAGWVFAPVSDLPAEVARGIGIRREWSEVAKADWERWLKRSLELNPSENNDHRTLITTLYQQALCHFGERYDERDQRLWWGEIWCIEKRPDNTTVWHREATASKVYYVDRPDLARLRLEMLRTFSVELGWSGNKAKAEQLFGVCPLSDHLRGEPAFMETETVDPADKIRERLRERRDCLAAYLKVKGTPADVAESQAFRVGDRLQVSFSIDGHVSPPQPSPTFFQPAHGEVAATLWLDTEAHFAEAGQPRDIAWDEVGSALCYAAKLPLEAGVVFSDLLRCGDDSLKRKLMNLGVTQADVTTALPQKPHRQDPPEQPTTVPLPPPVATPPTIMPPCDDGGSTESGGHRRPSDTNGAGGHGGGGSGGESEHHRNLKAKLASQPQLIETGFHSAREEYEFPSGDRADLVCEDANGNPVAIEVETSIAPGNKVGLWQAVKYKHLLAAERGLPCSHVRALLLAPHIPDDVKRECARLEIEPKEIPSSR